jgi:hypothetical protein
MLRWLAPTNVNNLRCKTLNKAFSPIMFLDSSVLLVLLVLLLLVLLVLPVLLVLLELLLVPVLGPVSVPVLVSSVQVLVLVLEFVLEVRVVLRSEEFKVFHVAISRTIATFPFPHTPSFLPEEFRQSDDWCSKTKPRPALRPTPRLARE